MSYVLLQNEAGTGLPMYFQVDPEGFYLSARCDRDKVRTYLCVRACVRVYYCCVLLSW